ncbi:hypothetical protein BLX06_28885 [Bacillus cereus]|uniref:Uncharacterized protein n=1 Tax=Bacillus cereus TaxID=1396 RepID=A0A9X6GCS4_BACCE|nr:hypothetical protein [Bacillus cereus]OOR71728.1 hypothetical protein BLX06_28885 [Bacillus cereus]
MARKVMAEQVVTDLEFLEMIQQFQWTTTSQLVSYIGFYNRRRILRKLEQLSPSISTSFKNRLVIFTDSIAKVVRYWERLM